MRRALVLAASLVVVVVATPSADAARWDPALRWNTLFTEHFAIHFHQGEAELAAELALVAEDVHELLTPYLKWEPFGRTQLAIVDPTDGANGYASTVPNNTIVLYAVQPTPDTSLDNYEHWMWAIFVHEYTHILQIDMVGGLPRAARMVLGRLITPNAVLPRWLTEGYAVYLETRFTTGGRGRSPYADMLLRVAALERKVPAIDMAEGYGQAWPRGATRYLYGGRFHFEVERRADGGDAAWVDFHQRHSRYVVPYFLPAKPAFGLTLSRMWKEWKVDLAADALADAERIASQGGGLTPTRIVPTRPEMAWRPRYTPDGESILYVHSSTRERSSLRVVRRDGSDEKRVRVGGVGRPVWSPDGTVIYWSGVGQTNRWQSYNDLYRYDPETKKRTRLTRGARLSDPAPHPDGGWLVAVQTHRGQNQLVRVDLPPDEEADEAPVDAPGGSAEGGDGPGITQGSDPEDVAYGAGDVAMLRPLTAAADGSQYSNPAWDPAGERLAVSVWKPGGFRDIHVFDADGRVLRSLTWDRASDSDPVWTPDGEHIVFVSDRDGVLNLYAYRWADGSFWRVTRLLGGARHPDVSPDGRHVAFQGYGADGWRIEELRLDPAAWEPVRIDPRALPGPGFGPSAQATAPLHPLEGVPGPELPFGDGPADAVARARTRAPYDTPATGVLPAPAEVQRPGPREKPDLPAELGTVRRYNPLRTLFPPRYLSLFGALTDTGAVGGIGTGGTDALSQHGWGASVHYRTDSRYIGWSAGYTLNAFRPVFNVGFSTIALDYGRVLLRTKGPAGPGGTTFPGVFRGADRYYERRDRLSAGVSIPVKRRHSISARYKLEFRSPLRELPDDADPDLLPARGSFSGVVVGWAFGEFRRYGASISPEDSHLISVSVDVESSWLGAFRRLPDGTRQDLHRAIVTAEAREYLSLPWGRNHVLALRVAVGATFGTDIPQRTFRIGGPYGDNPYVSLPDRYYALRGYPTSSMRGNHVYIGSAEYRLPLFYVERGFWTAPVWLRSVSLTIFAEAGQVFDTEDYASYAGSPDGFVAFWAATRPAVGVELVGDAVLGWAGRFQGRVGYGLGFGSGAYPAGTFYAQLGTSF